MNHSTTAILADDSIRIISCIFENIDRDWSLDPDAGVKAYSYKTTDASIKVGDIVAVQGPDRKPGEFRGDEFGMKFVKVVEVDVDIDFDSSIKYKWVVDKVNVEKHKETLAREKELIAHIQKLERQHKKLQLREALSQSGINLEGLSLMSPTHSNKKMSGTFQEDVYENKPKDLPDDVKYRGEPASNTDDEFPF